MAQLAVASARAAPPPARPVDPAPFTFALQLAAILDPAREKAFPAGRRGGKTRAACWALLLAALAAPRQKCIYLSTSINRAVDTLWEELTEVLEDAAVPFTANANARTFLFSNGSKIWISGVENKKQANKIRGRVRRTALVFIDEAQDWPTELLRFTYEVVLLPTLADVGGKTIMGGTGSAPRGYWYEHQKKAEVSVHRWTMFDNTLGVDDARLTLALALQKKGVHADVDTVIGCRGVGIDSEIAQEYFCEFVASEKQIFHATREKNAYAELPAGPWYHVLGGDLGSVDKAAGVVWGWTPTSPYLYLMAYDAQAGCSTDQEIAMLRHLAERFPSMVPAQIDPATGGANLILDLQQRYAISAEAADKDGKVAAVMLMRDAFRRGEIKLPASEWDADGKPVGEFLKALLVPEWDLDQPKKALKGHMPDLVDAALYGFRKTRAYDYEEREEISEDEAAEIAAVRALQEMERSPLDMLD